MSIIVIYLGFSKNGFSQNTYGSGEDLIHVHYMTMLALSWDLTPVLMDIIMMNLVIFVCEQRKSFVQKLPFCMFDPNKAPGLVRS